MKTLLALPTIRHIGIININVKCYEMYNNGKCKSVPRIMRQTWYLCLLMILQFIIDYR